MNFFKFFFGSSTSARAARDQWTPNTVCKNLISPINDYGTCFPCEGTGIREHGCRTCEGSGQLTGECRCCSGTGRFLRAAQPCFACQGGGKSRSQPCTRCGGSGLFHPAVDEACRACSGAGNWTSACKRCEGVGALRRTCHRCEGSGWFRF